MTDLVDQIEQGQVPGDLVGKSVFQYFNFVQGWLNSSAVARQKDISSANFFHQFQNWLSKKTQIAATIGWHGILRLRADNADAAFELFLSELSAFKMDAGELVDLEPVGIPSPTGEGRYFHDFVEPLAKKPSLYLGKDIYLLNAFVEGWIAFRETQDEKQDREFIEQFQAWVLGRQAHSGNDIRWPDVYRAINPDPGQAMMDALKQMTHFHQNDFKSNSV